MLHRHRSVSVLSASNVCPRGYSLCELPLPFCCRMPLCIAEYHGSARLVLVAERPASKRRESDTKEEGTGEGAEADAEVDGANGSFASGA
eukprot:466669-Rhodomonas_salina.2